MDLKTISEGKSLSQKDMIAMFEEHGETDHYKKFGDFEARLGRIGEKIVTSIDGEDETTNIVKDGDVVVKGGKGELYVLTPAKFQDRYTLDKHLTGNFQKFKAKGMIRAYQYEGDSFKFKASWGEDMLCNDGDWLCATETDGTPSEVYRIEKSVFPKTYKKAGW